MENIKEIWSWITSNIIPLGILIVGIIGLFIKRKSNKKAKIKKSKRSKISQPNNGIAVISDSEDCEIKQ
jgi:hypothetical protein